jgi:hypothetical protein
MVSELTRLTAPSLLSSVLQEWLAGVQACFFAAKPGHWTRYWFGYYAEVADATLTPYVIDGFSLGTYQLMVFDIPLCRERLRAKLDGLRAS